MIDLELHDTGPLRKILEKINNENILSNYEHIYRFNALKHA